MIASGGRRLPSEIELSCNDFVHAVRRKRPHWQRRRTDFATVNHWHAYWTEGIWDLAVADPQAAHEMAMSSLLPHQAQLVANQRQMRKGVLGHRLSIDYIDLKYQWAAKPGPFEIPYGEPIEAWRMDIGVIYWHQFSRQVPPGADTTWFDWFGSYLDLDRVIADRADFEALWLRELSPSDVKREWLQSALRWTQTQMKITDGNPADEQHSGYLPEADIFLSTDQRLVRALRAVHDQSPFPFAEARLVDRDTKNPFVEEIIAALS